VQKGHVSEKTDAFAFGILLIELLSDFHPLDARELADAHTELKARTDKLRDLAKQTYWTETLGARTTVCEIASQCTAGSSTRKTPAQVLPALEDAYNNGTFVPRGGTFARGFRRMSGIDMF
jgi:hypothetical protein